MFKAIPAIKSSIMHFWQRPFSWLAFGILLMAALSLSSSFLMTPNFIVQSSSALLLQGLFPVFFFSVYHLNTERHKDPSRSMWIVFFNWIASKPFRWSALRLFFLHTGFYFVLALLTLSANSIDPLGPRVALLTHLILSSFFLIATWRTPAILHQSPSDTLLFATVTSAVLTGRSLAQLVLYLIFIHIPLTVAFGGVYNLVHTLQAASSSSISSDLLPMFLVQHAPVGIYCVFFGILFQLLFWLVIVMQNYGPALYTEQVVINNAD